MTEILFLMLAVVGLGFNKLGFIEQLNGPGSFCFGYWRFYFV